MRILLVYILIMRTILVPVDITSTSENSVNFAVGWAKQYEYNHIILLKTSHESMFDYINRGDGYALVNGENINRRQKEANINRKMSN